MSHIHLQLATFSVVVNAIIRVITAILFIKFLIPLFVKEALVKNGLKVLRFEMLLTGLIIFLVNTIGLLIIVFNYFNLDTKIIVEIVTYINTIGFFIFALVKLRVYTQRYTPENKRLHEKFEEFEEKELKKISKKKVKKTNKI